jgi:hypothetical protein
VLCRLSARRTKHARRRASGVKASTSRRVIVMTDARVDTAHLVTDEAIDATGRYVAVCGMAVLPASLSAPIGRSCRGCTGWVFAWQRGLLGGV